MTDYLQTIMQEHLNSMQNSKSEFIKSKFIEKGFGHLVSDLFERRFQKLACVKVGDWSYYYADNDTKNGVFIVAIKDFDFDMSVKEENMAHMMTMSFKWQDTYEPPELKLL